MHSWSQPLSIWASLLESLPLSSHGFHAAWVLAFLGMCSVGHLPHILAL